MTFIVERAQELTGADGSVVELVEGEQLVYRAASGKAAPYVGLRLSKTSSLSGHCVETGNVISCPDVETDVRVDLKACHQIGVQSMVVVPLLQKDACLGVLKVLSTQTHFFSDREVQSLQLMAAFLANSIQLALEFDAKNALLGALEHSEAKYRSVINSLSEGIVLQDAESAILTSNASAEFILGLSLDQMMGRSSLDPRWKAIHEDGSPFPGEQHPAMVTLQTGVPVHNIVMGVHKPDGNLTWISINSQPLCHSGEVLPYAVVTSFSDITERKWAEAKIRASEQELRALFEAIHDVVLVRDAEGRCLKILSHCAGHLVKSPEEMLHKTLHETLPKAQADLLLSSIQQALALKKTVKCDYGLQIGEKETWFAANISPLSSNTAILVIRDISDRKTLEQELFREKELAQVTLHSIGDAVITTDAEGNIQYFNPVAEMLTGWSHAQSIGLPLSEVFNIVNETTRIAVDNPVVEALREDRIVGLANHTVLICRDGREIAIEDSAAPIRDHHGNLVGAVLVFHDVTQTRSLTRQLSWQASHDSLTQLVNRREFEIRVEQALVSAQSKALCHALGYLDLDQFKIVNDTCGHGAGDELLRQVTALLQSQVRKTDTLARLGGDEFGVLLDRCPLPQALRIANEMRECIQRFRFVWEEQTFKIGVSIGLITIDANSKSLSDVLSAADAACYSAKDKGRNRVHVFRTDDRDLLQQRGEMQWATRISRALEEDRFCLYYQMIAAIEPLSQNCEHYEVLLRLQDETGMLVSPMAFIPAAERYGLMHLIDRWVIRALFAAQGQHYQDIWNQCEIQGNFCNSLYAINLSGASINDDHFIEFLHEQFRLYQIPPQLICFEITETVAIANLTKASQFIRELKQLGCCFALDDFGSGMSSFAYLRNLPVDYLKIDGEFVRHIIERPVDDAMVEAMCRISHVMGIKIIAEFVENDAILARLKSLGVDYAQGYGIAKPLPLLEPHPVD